MPVRILKTPDYFEGDSGSEGAQAKAGTWGLSPAGSVYISTGGGFWEPIVFRLTVAESRTTAMLDEPKKADEASSISWRSSPVQFNAFNPPFRGETAGIIKSAETQAGTGISARHFVKASATCVCSSSVISGNIGSDKTRSLSDSQTG